MARRQSLEEWIREAILDSSDKGPNGTEAKITQITMMHTGMNQQQLELHTAKLNGSGDPSQLGAMFRNKAESYCQDLPGVQRFMLLAFYTGSNEPQARHPFNVTGIVAYEGGVSEEPTATGERAQSMRHKDSFLQQVFNQQQALNDYTLRIINNADQRVQRLEKENVDAINILKEMMFKQVTDTHELEMKRLQFERTTTERKKLLSYAPLLVNTILGREVFPQGAEDTALIEGIADALKPEDIELLAASGVIKPELMGPLFNRFQRRAMQKEEEARQNRMLQPPVEDPEKDAAGEIQ